MRIARAGWPFILPLAGLAVVVGLTLSVVVGIVLAVLAGYVAFFFRDPDRIPPAGEGLLLAPGDGRVMRVLDGDAGRQEIHVFLGLLDVHVNRAPADGVVVSVEKTGNAHLVAWKDEALKHNVQNHVVFDTAAGRLDMKQIVGFAARRLELWKSPGEHVRAGDRIGIMKFGSRIDLVLPPGTTVEVKSGDRVQAGISILGRLPAAERTGGRA